jgi:hypothetical protein
MKYEAFVEWVWSQAGDAALGPELLIGLTNEAIAEGIEVPPTIDEVFDLLYDEEAYQAAVDSGEAV